MFTTGDIVFILGKYVVENSEPCFTIAYSSVIGNENPNHKFNTTTLPICVPHCMYLAIVSREAKEVSEFVHFGAETIKYNSITSKPNVKMDLTIIYLFQSSRFKYLGPLGSNIKLHSTYFVSGLFRFSKSGKMMIEATDIDYLRTSTIGITTPESSSLTANTLSIIDIIDDDVNSIMQPKQQLESSLPSAKDINVNTSVTHDIEQLPNSDVHDQEVVELDDDMNLQDEADDFEEIQSNKKKIY
ncbi:28576_t:CDS:1 [Gigaspora margarita]|uniref:28576_t:CDS:1 n=1 Tax=Gigaspora margarita TaxID=4874 RepID=A0ABM8VZ65_GIGMA|nr:28576_t:CDS:1 [Gigaspora margarita]